MSRLVYYVAQSLDGYIADADGRIDWLTQFDASDGVAANYAEFMRGIGALIMGASTYELLLSHGGPWPYAGLPTWVFTHRALPRIEGADLRFTADDVLQIDARAREEAGEKSVWMVGGGNVAAQFAAHGRIDELRVTIIPLLLGAGAPMLPLAQRTPMTLGAITQFGRGLVELRYTAVATP